ncbi:hypothetical protein [Luteolibacter marinus]|uniref:hypothetical protein n=1 Tax=Luteolibacter marinus TaxID=2776705 RepID=UPI001D00CB19|nr:hypothetical protein [Luteolibacter marinus]
MLQPKMSRILLALTALTLAAQAKPRNLVDKEGREIVADIVSVSADAVKMKRSDGKTFDLPLDRLSDNDRGFLLELYFADLQRYKALNEVAGHELFSEKSFLERPAGEVAAALKMPAESRADGLLSWRLYAALRGGKPGSYRLFGAMPFSIALYAGPDGKAHQLSAVYANKGDFGSTAGFGEQHFTESEGGAPADLSEAMERDFDTISKNLTEALGDATKQRFGEGKSRRTVQRWDWNEVAILLAMEDEEFVTLSIVPAELADSGGKTVRVDDTSLKARLETSVKREANGDVLITGIPMVDQGPKGYCVPATFERAMRFMGIDADMYLLAMVGQSSAGGGTSPTLLIEEVKSQVYRKARRTREDQTDKLAIGKLARYIDKGTPVMWTMYSLPDYNEIANTNTAERAQVTSWDQWKEKIASQSEIYAKREPRPGNYHICMIIGYNSETNELAVSDSWGSRYELRWVPFEVANWVHGGGLFMIMP